jgi:deoxyribose-phosphate aldolase
LGYRSVKASGGIKTLTQAMAMIGAGANRLGIGSPASINIIKEFEEKLRAA